MYACDTLTSSRDQPTLIAPQDPKVSRPKRIALVIRGHCSFSHKVRVAEARGAHAVLVADDVKREGEMDEEGRERDGLLTMYSPGEFALVAVHMRQDLLLIACSQTTRVILPSRRPSFRGPRSCSSGTYTKTSSPAEGCMD
jgi:hypothetical protein